MRWIRRLSAITQLSLDDRGRNGGKEMDLRGTVEKAWTKPGAQVGVGSLARSYQNLSSEGNGVREGALCQEQGWSQSLELKPICPGGMSPLSRRPGLLDSPPSQDPLSPDPGACRWGPTGPSYEERGVERTGNLPIRQQEARIEGASYFGHSHCRFLQCWVQGRPLFPVGNIRIQDGSQSFSGPVLAFIWCLRSAKESPLPTRETD